MDMNRIKKKLSVLISSMLLIGALPPIHVVQADAASVCTINTNKTYQTIKGFGGMNIKECDTRLQALAPVHRCERRD